MDLKPLTPVQKHVYTKIYEQYKNEKISPTIRELMDSLNYHSTSAVWTLVRVLQEKGYIKIIDYKARGYIPLVDL